MRSTDCHVYESLPVGVMMSMDDERVPSGCTPVFLIRQERPSLRPDRLAVTAVGIEEPRPRTRPAMGSQPMRWRMVMPRRVPLGGPRRSAE